MYGAHQDIFILLNIGHNGTNGVGTVTRLMSKSQGNKKLVQ